MRDTVSRIALDRSRGGGCERSRDAVISPIAQMRRIIMTKGGKGGGKGRGRLRIHDEIRFAER